MNKQKIYNGYSNEIILQVTLPKVVDVSSVDYEAEKININTGAVDSTGDIQPFIICHSEEVTLKVDTWKGVAVTWTFPAGPYPMLLSKIYTDGANTATSIQIGY